MEAERHAPSGRTTNLQLRKRKRTVAPALLGEDGDTSVATSPTKRAGRWVDGSLVSVDGDHVHDAELLAVVLSPFVAVVHACPPGRTDGNGDAGRTDGDGDAGRTDGNGDAGRTDGDGDASEGHDGEWQPSFSVEDVESPHVTLLRRCCHAAEAGQWSHEPPSSREAFIEWLVALLRAPPKEEHRRWGLRALARVTEHLVDEQDDDLFIESGMLDVVTRLLSDPSVCDATRALCCVTLGHVASGRPRLVEAAVACGSANALLSTLEQIECSVEVAREALWALGELCIHPRDSEWPPRLLDVLRAVLDADPCDPSVVEEACWSTAAVAGGGHFGAKALVESGLLVCVVGRIRRVDSPAMAGDWMVPALRTLAKLTGGSDCHADVVVESGVLVPLRGLLCDGVPLAIRREACIVVANLCAGSSAQLRAVFDAGIVPTMIENCCARTHDDVVSGAVVQVRVEAAWAIASALSQATVDQVLYLMQLGAAHALLALLPQSDAVLALTMCKAVRRAFRVCTVADANHTECIDDAVDVLEDTACRPDATEELGTVVDDLLALAADP